MLRQKVLTVVEGNALETIAALQKRVESGQGSDDELRDYQNALATLARHRRSGHSNGILIGWDDDWNAPGEPPPLFDVGGLCMKFLCGIGALIAFIAIIHVAVWIVEVASS